MKNLISSDKETTAALATASPDRTIVADCIGPTGAPGRSGILLRPALMAAASRCGSRSVSRGEDHEDVEHMGACGRNAGAGRRGAGVADDAGRRRPGCARQRHPAGVDRQHELNGSMTRTGANAWIATLNANQDAGHNAGACRRSTCFCCRLMLTRDSLMLVSDFLIYC